jgi:hypothetical protein
MILLLLTTSCKSKKINSVRTNKQETINIPDGPVVFPGCINDDKLEECLITAANYYIVRGFDQDLLTNLNVVSGEKIVKANFTVDKTGNVVDVKIESNDNKLIPDAILFLQSLPKMQPAIKKGLPVRSVFQTSVIFNFSESLPNEEEDINELQVIETPPIYPGCKGSKTELNNCFNKSVRKHISRWFNIDIANELGLSPGQKKINIRFSIDKEGNIANIKARGPHNVLEIEAIKTINKLPKIQPAIFNKKPIEVKFNLPIVFKVIDDF